MSFISSSTNNSNSIKSKLLPKEIRLIRDPSSGYGFNITGAAPVSVSIVNKGSVAEAANLQVGDKIIEVNEHNVRNAGHKEVASLIKTSSTRLTLRVISTSPVLNILDKPPTSGRHASNNGTAKAPSERYDPRWKPYFPAKMPRRPELRTFRKWSDDKAGPPSQFAALHARINKVLKPWYSAMQLVPDSPEMQEYFRVKKISREEAAEFRVMELEQERMYTFGATSLHQHPIAEKPDYVDDTPAHVGFGLLNDEELLFSTTNTGIHDPSPPHPAALLSKAVLHADDTPFSGDISTSAGVRSADSGFVRPDHTLPFSTSSSNGNSFRNNNTTHQYYGHPPSSRGVLDSGLDSCDFKTPPSIQQILAEVVDNVGNSPMLGSPRTQASTWWDPPAAAVEKITNRKELVASSAVNGDILSINPEDAHRAFHVDDAALDDSAVPHPNELVVRGGGVPQQDRKQRYSVKYADAEFDPPFSAEASLLGRTHINDSLLAPHRYGGGVASQFQRHSDYGRQSAGDDMFNDTEFGGVGRMHAADEFPNIFPSSSKNDRWLGDSTSRVIQQARNEKQLRYSPFDNDGGVLDAVDANHESMSYRNDRRTLRLRHASKSASDRRQDPMQPLTIPNGGIIRMDNSNLFHPPGADNDKAEPFRHYHDDRMRPRDDIDEKPPDLFADGAIEPSRSMWDDEKMNDEVIVAGSRFANAADTMPQSPGSCSGMEPNTESDKPAGDDNVWEIPEQNLPLPPSSAIQPPHTTESAEKSKTDAVEDNATVEIRIHAPSVASPGEIRDDEEEDTLHVTADRPKEEVVAQLPPPVVTEAVVAPVVAEPLPKKVADSSRKKKVESPVNKEIVSSAAPPKADKAAAVKAQPSTSAAAKSAPATVAPAVVVPPIPAALLHAVAVNDKECIDQFSVIHKKEMKKSRAQRKPVVWQDDFDRVLKKFNLTKVVQPPRPPPPEQQQKQPKPVVVTPAPVIPPVAVAVPVSATKQTAAASPAATGEGNATVMFSPPPTTLNVNGAAKPTPEKLVAKVESALPSTAASEKSSKKDRKHDKKSADTLPIAADPAVEKKAGKQDQPVSSTTQLVVADAAKTLVSIAAPLVGSTPSAVLSDSSTKSEKRKHKSSSKDKKKKKKRLKTSDGVEVAVNDGPKPMVAAELPKADTNAAKISVVPSVVGKQEQPPVSVVSGDKTAVATTKPPSEPKISAKIASATTSTTAKKEDVVVPVKPVDDKPKSSKDSSKASDQVLAPSKPSTSFTTTKSAAEKVSAPVAAVNGSESSSKKRRLSPKISFAYDTPADIPTSKSSLKRDTAAAAAADSEFMLSDFIDKPPKRHRTTILPVTEQQKKSAVSASTTSANGKLASDKLPSSSSQTVTKSQFGTASATERPSSALGSSSSGSNRPMYINERLTQLGYTSATQREQLRKQYLVNSSSRLPDYAYTIPDLQRNPAPELRQMRVHWNLLYASLESLPITGDDAEDYIKSLCRSFTLAAEVAVPEATLSIADAALAGSSSQSSKLPPGRYDIQAAANLGHAAMLSLLVRLTQPRVTLASLPAQARQLLMLVDEALLYVQRADTGIVRLFQNIHPDVMQSLWKVKILRHLKREADAFLRYKKRCMERVLGAYMCAHGIHPNQLTTPVGKSTARPASSSGNNSKQRQQPSSVQSLDGMNTSSSSSSRGVNSVGAVSSSSAQPTTSRRAGGNAEENVNTPASAGSMQSSSNNNDAAAKNEAKQSVKVEVEPNSADDSNVQLTYPPSPPLLHPPDEQQPSPLETAAANNNSSILNNNVPSVASTASSTSSASSSTSASTAASIRGNNPTATTHQQLTHSNPNSVGDIYALPPNIHILRMQQQQQPKSTSTSVQLSLPNQQQQHHHRLFRESRAIDQVLPKDVYSNFTENDIYCLPGGGGGGGGESNFDDVWKAMDAWTYARREQKNDSDKLVQCFLVWLHDRMPLTLDEPIDTLAHRLYIGVELVYKLLRQSKVTTSSSGSTAVSTNSTTAAAVQAAA